MKLFFGKDNSEVEIKNIAYLAKDKPLTLSCGEKIKNFPIAYETYGKLNANKSNAILICHALTGDQFVASKNPVTGKEGWWDNLVGSGKAIDTDRFFVICSNVLGGCLGSFGPKSENEKTKKPYALDFPIITISDMVNAQKLLVQEFFDIKQLFSLVGGSMGGMQVLEWITAHPEMVKSAIPIATASHHSAQNIAFHEVGRQAIMSDPNWCQGKYIEKKSFPEKGLSVARMTAHITYLSERALAEKFGRNLQDKKKISFDFVADFQIESYLHHQGYRFVDRFDANSYLYITRAMDYFDLSADHDEILSEAFKNAQNINICIISFSDDWLFPTSEAKTIVEALHNAHANASFIEIKSNRGHDSFLIENDDFQNIVSSFLKGQQ
jgi:homoserine O-acetyltransferase